MDFLYVIAFIAALAIFVLLEIVIGFLLINLLHKIDSRPLKIVITILFYIVFLPCMVAVHNSLNTTSSERKLAPFSYSLRSKSKLLILINLIYALGLYFLFQK